MHQVLYRDDGEQLGYVLRMRRRWPRRRGPRRYGNTPERA
jgi:hypothetical protein